MKSRGIAILKYQIGRRKWSINTKSKNGDGAESDLNNHADEDDPTKNMNDVKLDPVATRSDGDETKRFEIEKDDLELGSEQEPCQRR